MEDDDENEDEGVEFQRNERNEGFESARVRDDEDEDDDEDDEEDDDDEGEKEEEDTEETDTEERAEEAVISVRESAALGQVADEEDEEDEKEDPEEKERAEESPKERSTFDRVADDDTAEAAADVLSPWDLSMQDNHTISQELIRNTAHWHVDQTKSEKERESNSGRKYFQEQGTRESEKREELDDADWLEGMKKSW